MDRTRRALAAGLVATFVFLNVLAPTRRFFALDQPSVLVLFATLGVVGVAYAALAVGWVAATTASAAMERRKRLT